TFNYFYALYVLKWHWNIHHVVPCLGVSEFDAVDQHQRLIKTSSTDSDISLGAAYASLTHVDPRHERKYFLKASSGRGFDACSLNDVDVAWDFTEGDLHPVLFNGKFIQIDHSTVFLSTKMMNGKTTNDAK